MRKLFIILIVSGLIVTIGIYINLIRYAHSPAGTATEDKVITIRPGENFREIADILFEEGLIRHPNKFILFARIKDYDEKIKAGDYLLSANMPPAVQLQTLVKGKIHFKKVTIPEGYTIRLIAGLLEKHDVCPASRFIKKATDEDFAKDMGVEGETFEGYLFPDTYYFSRNESVKTVIENMVNRLFSLISPEMRRRMEKIGFSFHEMLTLASLIEKEAGVTDEMSLISSVFHNRLQKNMRLQSDPTVIYGLSDFDGNLTRKHLRTKTPYNTYTIKGLPPGPIANPGLDAIRAALYPADTSYIFFVSRNDGTHEFTASLREHKRAVRRFQKNR